MAARVTTEQRHQVARQACTGPRSHPVTVCYLAKHFLCAQLVCDNLIKFIWNILHIKWK